MDQFEHQAKIIAENKPVAGMFLGTGTGKTRIALGLAEGVTNIFAPKTQRDDENWERELVKMERELDINVFSKESVRADSDDIRPCETLIVDEAHRFLGVTPNTRQCKGKRIPKTSQLFEALESYIERVKPKRLYLCTASIMRSPMTVWAAGKLLGRLDVVGDYYTFRDHFYVQLPMESFTPIYASKRKDTVKDELVAMVRKLGYVGRLSDFFDVPKDTWKTDMIPLSKKQEDRIKQLFLDYPDSFTRNQKVHQVENGHLIGTKFKKPEYFDEGKIEKILEYADEFSRMVVFAKYTLQIEQIEAALHKAGKKVLCLTGDTKSRGELFTAARTMPECVFICQSQISDGWELKEYPVMIFASRTNSFVDFDQGIGRIQRADNLKKNLYIKLISQPIIKKGKQTIGGIDVAIDRSLAQGQDFNERLYANNK